MTVFGSIRCYLAGLVSPNQQPPSARIPAAPLLPTEISLKKKTEWRRKKGRKKYISFYPGEEQPASSRRALDYHISSRRAAPIRKPKTGGKKMRKMADNTFTHVCSLRLPSLPLSLFHHPLQKVKQHARKQTRAQTPLCTIRLFEDRGACSLRRGAVR